MFSWPCVFVEIESLLRGSSGSKWVLWICTLCQSIWKSFSRTWFCFKEVINGSKWLSTANGLSYPIFFCFIFVINITIIDKTYKLKARGLIIQWRWTVMKKKFKLGSHVPATSSRPHLRTIFSLANQHWFQSPPSEQIAWWPFSWWFQITVSLPKRPQISGFCQYGLITLDQVWQVLQSWFELLAACRLSNHRSQTIIREARGFHYMTFHRWCPSHLVISISNALICIQTLSKRVLKPNLMLE